EIVECIKFIRFQSEGFAETRLGFFDVPSLLEGNSQIVPSFGKLRPQTNCVLESGNGVSEPTLILVSNPQVVSSRRIIGKMPVAHSKISDVTAELIVDSVGTSPIIQSGGKIGFDS